MTQAQSRLVRQLKDLVADINTHEVAGHMAEDNVTMWTRSWRVEARKTIEELEKTMIERG